jgi:hypothetical protein
VHRLVEVPRELLGDRLLEEDVAGASQRFSAMAWLARAI